MISWLTGLGLKVKIYGAVIAAVLISVGILYARFRMAQAKALSSTQRAEALERARAAELRISERIAKVRSREREWRQELEKRTVRDHFEQGWGP